MEWNIAPLDTLFFRGSESFNRGESPFLRSVFPPTPQTLQGFVRTAILEASCYDIRLYSRNSCARCPQHEDCTIPATIGNAEEKGKPGNLRLRGPHIVWSDGQRVKRVYVAPHDLVSRKEDTGNTKYLRLTPREPIECDLGKVCFPIAEDGLSACEWLTEHGLETYLEGNVPEPEEIVSGHLLWDVEPKIGIARDKVTHTAQEHMLYSIETVRLRPGVSLGIRVDGIDSGLQSRLNAVYRLGGEGHLVSVSIRPEAPLPIPKNLTSSIEASGRFRLVLLQPADFDGNWLPPGFQASQQDGKTVWQGNLNAIHLSLVAACLGRPQKIGGWDLARPGPAPVKSCVPAGTVYYFQANPGQGEDIVRSFHDASIGVRGAFGFGHVAVGCWNEA